jgi:hypothetical protein
MKKIKIVLLPSIGLLAPFSGSLFSVSAEIESLKVPEYISNRLRETAMPSLKNSKLGTILSRYYAFGMGGIDIWNEIQSMRFEGSLFLEGIEFDMLCFQRKPNRYKLMLTNSSEKFTLSYDGQDAWQSLSRNHSLPMDMSPNDARSFIHFAIFGNYLLYPYRAGKRIEYLGTTREVDTICHRVRVTLDTGFIVDYYIDIRSFLDKKIVNYDERTGSISTLICEDFRVIEGFPIAHKITSISDDGTETLLLLEQVKFNIGLTDWIFQRPR